MSLEGKSAACAHLSSVGNIAGAYADLWSNESVQNVRLLSAIAPVVSMEQLVYDCRLYNVSLKNHRERELRDWLVESDASLDPQAYIFRPEIVVKLASAVVEGLDDYERSRNVARATLECIREGKRTGRLLLADREQQWLDTMDENLGGLPEDQEEFIRAEKDRWKEFVRFEEYGV